MANNYLACLPDYLTTGFVVLEGLAQDLVLTVFAVMVVAGLSELQLFDRAKSVLADALRTMTTYMYPE